MSNCVANDLKTLAACFIEQASDNNGQIVIDKSYLSRLITDLIGDNDITIGGVNPGNIPTNPGSSLVINGLTTGDFLNLDGLPVCLVFFYYGGTQQVVLQMCVTLGTGWKFGTSFPDLAGQAADYLTSTSQYLYLSSAPVAQALPSGACPQSGAPASLGLLPGVSALGNYRLLGPLGPVIALLPGAHDPTFQLYGAITENPTPPGPAFNLSLQTQGLSFSIPGNILTISQPTVGLEVEYVPAQQYPTVVSPVTIPYFSARIIVGSLPLNMMAKLWGELSYLEIYIVPANPQQTTFASLVSLVGSGPLSGLTSLLQQQQGVWSLLNSIAFKQFYCMVTTEPSLAEIDLLIGTIGYDPQSPTPPITNAWNPFNGIYLAFDVSVSVFDPASAPLVMAELQATLWWKKQDSSYYSFTVTVSIPDWTITGVFNGTITLNLASLVGDLFGSSLLLPNDLANFEISNINFNASVPGKRFAINALVNGELFGSSVLQLINVGIGLSVDASSSPTKVTGSISGIISVFTIQFQVDAVISNDPNVDTVFKIHLVNETIGGMLNKLVSIIDPDLKISLPSPWDKLLDISLDALVLEINVSKGTVSLSYDANIDLVFIQIETISLTFQKDPVQSGVLVNITGSFLGQSFGKENPLGWDAVNGTPPAVPQGSLLDMRYLGIGQHVTVQGLEDETSMQAIIDKMIAAMKSTTPDFTNGLVFSDASGWLIGTDFTIMGAVRLSIIFNDPKVYGLLIQLSGEKVGSFAGLSFEILYRKITENIGLYHIDFTLPDEFRHLEFGEVSITLPTLILDIYTNGNFLVNLGFPQNMNFANSFCVQVFPFIGYGGIYFGVLSGATSSRVPKITNGNFDPVIVFGFALSVGVGKTINEGIFSAGISVTVEGALEGVIGWFNPNSPAVKSDKYFWLQGTIRIVGQLYGTVDFAIIKASVSVVVYASATLVVESYEPIFITLSAGVSVTASVKIVFFTIHFSFSMTVTASWTIGSKGTPPWRIASGSDQSTQKAAAPLLFASTLHPADRFFPTQARLNRIAALRSASSEAPLQWAPAPRFTSTAIPLNVIIGPAFTVTGTPRTVPLLLLENSIDPSALTAAEVRNVSDAAAASNKPFNLLARALLNWAVVAWQRNQDDPGTTISMGDLHFIQEQLACPDAEDVAFPYSNISQFLANNFNLQITNRPTSNFDDSSAAILPMIPELSMTVSGNTIYFDNRSAVQVGPDYTEKLAAYFQALSAQYMQRVAQTPPAAACPTAQGTAESLATSIFRNYFFMVAKATVSSALDLLTSYTYSPGSQSLQQICNSFPRSGDQEVTPESVVHSNQSTSGILTAQPWTLSGVVYQARSGDTLSSWLTPFGLSAIDLLSVPVSRSAQSANQYLVGLLQTGATLAINSAKTPPTNPLVFVSAAGDTFNLIASLMLVRNAGTSVYSQLTGLSDMAQSIALLNNLQSIDPSQPLPSTVATLLIPTAVSGSPATYTVRPDDSLYAVSAYFLNVQQQAVPTSAFVNTLMIAYPGIDPNNVPIGARLTLPEIDHTVRLGESVASIAGALLLKDPGSLLPADLQTLLNASDLAGVNLQPLVGIPVPPFQYTVKDSDSLAGIAQQFNLTLADLADVLLNQANLFNTTINIPNVPAIDVEELLSAVTAYGNLNSVSAMASRFLLHGMQVPDPADPITAAQLLENPSLAAEVKTDPLYQLMGQQVATPTAPPIFTFGNAGGVSWITLGEGVYVVQQGDTLASILNAFVAPAQQAAFTTWLTKLNATVDFQNLTAGEALTFPTSAPLSASYTVQDSAGETLTQISEALAPGQPAVLRAQILDLNSSISPTNPIPQGTVITLPPSFPNLALELILTSDELSLSSSLSGLQPSGAVALYRLPLFNNTPTRYTLQKHMPWQASQIPPFLGSAGSAGGPTVWMFPDPLIAALDGAQDPNLRYGVFVGIHESANQPMTINPAKNFAWGTLININVQKIPGASGQAGAANAYLLNGADQVGQDLLHDLLPYVNTNTTLYLLYQPNGTSNSVGYASDVLDPNATFVLQTNLSQLSNSPSANVTARAALLARRLAAALSPYAGAIGDAPDFLNLLWQCGIVRSGGYYLNYFNANGGSAIPDGAFASGNSATIGLLVVLNGTTPATPTSTALPSFINCAVVADNIDATSANVFVQPIVLPVQPSAPDNSLQGLVTTYNSTYGATIDVTGLVTVNQDVRGLLQPGASIQLSSSAAYPIQEGDTFGSISADKGVSLSTLASLNSAGTAILRMGALVQFAAGQLDQTAAVQPGNTGFQMERPAPTSSESEEQQYVEQIFQMVEYGITSNGFFNSSGQGLPAGPTDPNPQGGDTLLGVQDIDTTTLNYSQVFSVSLFAHGIDDVAPATSTIELALPAKVGGPYAGIARNSTVQLGVSYRDIFGNTGTANPPLALNPIPAGYIDDIIGFGQWPGVVLSYLFNGDQSNPRLVIGIAFQPSRYTPDAASNPTPAIQAAIGAAANLKQIYYQIQQPDLILRYRSSLDVSSMNDTSRNPADPYLLDKSSSIQFAAHAYLFTTAMGALQAYQYTTGGSDTVGGVAGSFGITPGQLFNANKTAAQNALFSGPLQVPIIYSVRPQDSLQSIVDAAAKLGYSVTAAQIATNNQSTPLTESIDMTTPQARSYTTTGSERAQDLTATMNCSIAGIVKANDVPGVLAVGFKFTAPGQGSATVTYQVQDGDTFTRVSQAFASQYHLTVDPVSAATLNQTTPGMFAPKIALTIPDLVIQPGQTFAAIQNKYSYSIADTAQSNLDLAGIFPQSTLLLVREAQPQAVATDVPMGWIDAEVQGAVRARRRRRRRLRRSISSHWMLLRRRIRQRNSLVRLR